MIYNISQHFGYTCNENANFKKAVETALCKYRVRNLRIGRFFFVVLTFPVALFVEDSASTSILGN